MEVHHKAKPAADRLSTLPDCLLHIILSRLKALQVVQTCVLSRRWQHLWLTSPCLDVDITEFLPQAALHPSPHRLPYDADVPSAFHPVAVPLPRQHIAQEDEEFYGFEDFVECLLIHRCATGASPLDTMRLRIPPWWLAVPWMLCGSSITTKYTSWLRRVLRCTPAALDVSGFVKLPRLASPSTRRLTKLRLDRVFLHRDFAEHLKSGLPVLEDLEISGTELSGLKRIASDTLKHLAIDSSSAITLNAGGSLAFAIVAPRLVSLHLAVQFLHLGFFGVVVEEAPRLARASIRLVDKPEFRQRMGGIYFLQEDRALVTSLCNLLGSLSHVGALELYGFHDMTVVQQHIPLFPPPGGPGVRPHLMYQHRFPHQTAMPPLHRPMIQAILEEEHGGLPVFHGLTSLVLDECEAGHEFRTLWRLLDNAPVLEKLTLKNCQCHMFPNVSAMELPRLINVSSNLKSVEIMYDDRDDNRSGGYYKVRVKSSYNIKWRLPATTTISVTKLPKD